MRSLKLIHSVFVIFPLIAGLLIYLLFRTPETWLHFILNIHTTPFSVNSSVSNFYLFHLPDFLWAFSFSYAVLWSQYPKEKIVRIITIIIFILFAEFLQLLLKGATFDWLDISIELAAAFTAILLFKNPTP
jgi:hypothetical protein